MAENNNHPKKPAMKLPEIKMGKALLRRTLIAENGMTYEIDEEIDIPVFGSSTKQEESCKEKK